MKIIANNATIPDLTELTNLKEAKFFSKAKFKIYDIEKYNGVLDIKKIKKIISNYNSIVQNLRLIKRPAENRWTQQQEK